MLLTWKRNIRQGQKNLLLVGTLSFNVNVFTKYQNTSHSTEHRKHLERASESKLENWLGCHNQLGEGPKGGEGE